jgi:hypothetical protein
LALPRSPMDPYDIELGGFRGQIQIYTPAHHPS